MPPHPATTAVPVVRIRRRGPAPAPKPPAPPAVQGIGRDAILERIVAIKHQAHRLRPPSAHRPEQWHEDKSDMVREIERLEDELRGRPGAR